jgi:tetratricopeptide (TPR) repeat protein
VYLTQSRLCVIQKDLAGASEHLREGLASNPRNPELLEALAEVELQARRPDRALEALGQVPQLPEKALALCERALRDTLRSGTLDEGLRLFKPIGRELARRGQGEVAAKSLRAALGGSLTQEAWIQLADIAHQSGNRAEQVECLRQAHGAARTQGDRILADTIAQQLQGMGVRLEDLDAPAPGEPRPAAAGAPASPDAPSILETTELDPIKRMQIQQLEREAEQSLRNRFVDRALETFARILEMDPANVDVINRIADIHRASGVLTKVQMHYVKTAERVALLGYKVLAVELLDKAEAMFPGSTRLYRRNLGLLDIQAAPSVPLPPSPSIPLAAPVEALPVIELDGGPSLGLRRP